MCENEREGRRVRASCGGVATRVHACAYYASRCARLTAVGVELAAMKEEALFGLDGHCGLRGEGFDLHLARRLHPVVVKPAFADRPAVRVLDQRTNRRGGGLVPRGSVVRVDAGCEAHANGLCVRCGTKRLASQRALEGAACQHPCAHSSGGRPLTPAWLNGRSIDANLIKCTEKHV